MLVHHALLRGLLAAGTALAAQAVVAGPASAVPADAGTQPYLAGLSSQQQPVLLRLTADHRVLTTARTTLRLKCTSGGSFYLPDDFTNVTVTSDRRFKESFNLPPQAVDATKTVEFSGAFAGRVTRAGTRATGTWQLTTVERDPTTSAVTDTCTPGSTHFTVHR